MFRYILECSRSLDNPFAQRVFALVNKLNKRYNNRLFPIAKDCLFLLHKPQFSQVYLRRILLNPSMISSTSLALGWLH